MNKVQYKIIGRGQASWHADAGTVEHGAISGGGEYTTKESSNGGTLEGYAAEAVEGCLVYDASEVDSDLFIRHVYNDPMVDVDLLPGTMRESYFGGRFSHVAVDVFEGLLRKMPGMKFGRVIKGKVVWE